MAARALERAYNAAQIAGVDEAGRGPLAGPVVAAACVWPLDEPPLDEINDSKALSAEIRDTLYDQIMSNPRVGVGVGIVDHATIDDINILQATMLAMRTAVEDLPPEFEPTLALIDGNRCPKDLKCNSEALIKGDSRCYSIAAASIVAKVTRDRLMKQLHEAHPQYGFDKHMGYPTKDHVAALHRYGPIREHRRSFNPLRTWIAEGKVAWEPATSIAPAQAPKKSGRPDGSKSTKVAEDARGEPAPMPKKRGRPALLAARQEQQEAPAPKKRGRPSKPGATQGHQADGTNVSKAEGSRSSVSGPPSSSSDSEQDESRQGEEHVPAPRGSRGRAATMCSANPVQPTLRRSRRNTTAVKGS